MVILPNPQGTKEFLVNSTIILPFYLPKGPLQSFPASSIYLRTCELITEGTNINGFIIQDCIVSVESFEVANTRCDSNLCDRQDDNLSRCACFQMTSRCGVML